MSYSIKDIYNISPVFMQTIFLNLYSAKINYQRFGNKFYKMIDWLSKTQFWTDVELKSYQEERLKLIIKHAFETVPFYKEKMVSLKLRPEDIRSLEDLHKMPIIKKQDIKLNIRNMLSTKFYKRNLVHGSTSGTTGSPLDLYYDSNMALVNNAVDWRQKKWASLELGERHAVILGRVTVPLRQKKPPYWRLNYIHKQLWMSAFHMSEDNLYYYVNKLQEFEPKVIEGYPSTIYILARFLNENDITVPVSAILTSSETLYPYQKDAIEKAFKSRIFDFFGHAERVIFASECSNHSGKHLNLEYGITELVDRNGKAVPAGSMGYMVGTSLHNFGMPLIRYMTDDITILKNNKCSCGRTLPLIEDITTKQDDILVMPDGRFISPSVLTHPFKPQKNIKESQIIQKGNKTIIIRIVKASTFTLKDEKRLLNELRERLGTDVEILTEYVNSIPREKSGKYRWVITDMGAYNGL